ncbi:MAG: hypothetical protein U5L10_04905 [Candidatus Moranbacteria bacterium]|nr:hypothetical protein [Candidatus Moranbacteria bacterium]
MKKIITSLLTLSLLFFGWSLFAKAQQQDGARMLEKTDCFNYYKFGSVDVETTASVKSTVSGSPVNFQTTVTNNNPYPVVDGKIYAKVFRKQDRESDIRRNGHFVVDQFVVQDDLNLNANESRDLSFKWDVPSYAVSGQYQIAMFFVSADRFNLLGLTFTDDVVGNTANFQVSGEVEKNAEFEKNSVVLNDADYNFINQYIPILEKDKPAVVEAPLRNTTGESQVIKVNWEVYAWDGMAEENSIKKVEEKVTVPAGGRKVVDLEIQDTEEPVYLVVAEAQYKDSPSFLNIRFGREGLNEPRINFAGIENYPLKKEGNNKIFACVHGTGLDEKIDGNELRLALTDEEGNEIQNYNYKGEITGAVMGLEADLDSSVDSDKFQLKASLFHKGKKVDETSLRYDCADLSPDGCSADKKASLPQNMNELFLSSEESQASLTVMKIVLVLLSILTIVLIYMYLSDKRKKAKKGGENQSKNKGFKVLLTLLFAGSFLWSGVCLAASNTVNNYQKNLNQYGKMSGDEKKEFLGSALKGNSNSNWINLGSKSASHRRNFNVIDGRSGHADLETWSRTAARVGATQLSVTYRIGVLDEFTQELVDNNTTVPVGSTLVFSQSEPKISDISWNIAGHSWDTPYGYWMQDAGDCKPGTNQNNYEKHLEGGTGQHKYSKYDLDTCYSVDYPEFEINHKGTAELSCAEGGRVCIVTAPGTINTNFTFKENDSTFYTKAKKFQDGSTGWTGKYEYAQASHKIPEMDLDYHLQAQETDDNNPPEAPKIEGPDVGYAHEKALNEFKFTSADPDGDRLKYGIDWDKDNRVDQWVPATDFIASGVAKAASKAWVTTGMKSFQALARDENGLSSGWAEHAIDIQDFSVDLKVNGEDNLTGDDELKTETDLVLSWDTNNIVPGSCVASGTDKDNFSGSKPDTGETGPFTFQKTTNHTYILTCSMKKTGVPIEDTVDLEMYCPEAELDFSANPNEIIKGGDVNLNWSVKNAVDCQASNDSNLEDWTGKKEYQDGLHTQSVTLEDFGEYNFFLDCWNADETHNKKKASVDAVCKEEYVCQTEPASCGPNDIGKTVEGEARCYFKNKQCKIESEEVPLSNCGSSCQPPTRECAGSGWNEHNP